MMKSVSKLLFVLFTFLLLACDQKENKNGVYKTVKWKNGNIQSEGYYVNDSIKEGLFKGYYQNGKLKYEANYHNNKPNGLTTQYFESGKKRSIATYKNGKRSGSGEGYYENGKIKWYQLSNRKGKARFEIDFLEDGKIKSVKGNPVVDTTFNQKNFRVGDTLKISFTVAIPSNSKVQFHIYGDMATKQNGNDLDINEKEGTVKYEKVLDKKGIMKWGGEYLIKFDYGEKIKYPYEEEFTVK